MRRSALTIVLSLIAALCYGQGVIDRSLAYKDEFRLIGAETAMSYSALSFLNDSLPTASKVQLNFNLREESQAYLPQNGDGLRLGEFKADSRRKWGKSAVRGGVSYQRGYKKNVCWNTSSDFELLYPYVLADSVGGKLQMEQYAFYGAWAGHAGDWTLGAEGNYRALHEYRDVDPRPRNISSDFKARFSAAHPFHSYLAGINLSYRKYHQSQSVSFYDRSGANTVEMHFTGLGTTFARFTSPTSNSSTRYKGHGFEASLLLQPLDGKRLYAGLSYNLTNFRRLLINQNEVPITDLLVQEVSAFSAYSWQKNVFKAALEGELSYELRQGTENIIDNGKTGIYEKLADLTMYRNRVISLDVKSALSGRLPLVFSPKLGGKVFLSEYVYPQKYMDFAYLYAGSGVSANREIGKAVCRFEAGAYYLANLHSNLKLDGIDEAIGQAYTDMFNKFSDSSLRLDLSASANRQIKKDIAAFAAIDIKYYAFVETKSSVQLGLSAGLLF